MLVDDFYRNMVGYVVEERWDRGLKEMRRAPVGTAFVVYLQTGNVVTYYAVTCKHVILPGRDRKKLPIFLRMNSSEGRFKDIPAPSKEWTQSSTSDVAVSVFSADPAQLQLQPCPIEHMRRWSNDPPVPGYDVFTAGLFASYPGEESVQVLVRSGRVARENACVEVTVDVSTQRRQMIDAYLIEANAWQGESGSPVFAYTEKHTFKEDRSYDPAFSNIYPHPVETRYESELIGMLQGHFRVDDDGTAVNAGIAIVVPVNKIIETLMDPMLVKDREAKAARQTPMLTKPLTKKGD